jgi:hypothetical protein
VLSPLPSRQDGLILGQWTASRFGEAARLLGAAEHLREMTKYARWAPARDEPAPVLVEIEAALGMERFVLDLSEGRRLTWKERWPMRVGAEVTGAGRSQAGIASPHRSDVSPPSWAKT